MNRYKVWRPIEIAITASVFYITLNPTLNDNWWMYLSRITYLEVVKFYGCNNTTKIYSFYTTNWVIFRIMR